MWSLGSVRIYVDSHDSSGSQTVARLQPLEGGSVTQVFGYEDPIVKISGLIVGEDNKATLEGYYKSGSTYTLSGNGISDVTGRYVKRVSFSRSKFISQTMDLVSHVCDDPVYNVELELY